MKNQNQTKHGARAECRNVCRGAALSRIRIGKTLPQQGFGSGSGSGSAAIYFKSIANEGIEDEWLALCCHCYYCIWRWWWAMIRRCSAEVCQVPGASFGASHRILCGCRFPVSRQVLANASKILPSLKNFVCMLWTFLIKSSGRRQIELAKVRPNIGKRRQNPPTKQPPTKPISFQKNGVIKLHPTRFV